MGKLISHGAPDEVFVMGEIGFQLDVAALIDRVNAAPLEELDIREVTTASLIDAASSNDIRRTVEISAARMEEPVLLIVLTVGGEQRHWVVDGTHRLRARAAAGKQTTRMIAVKPAMVQDLFAPFSLW